MSIGINEIISKKEYTYEDIIKLNSAINRQCKYCGGKAIKHMTGLYSHQLWTIYLDKSLTLFDNQKFAVVYLDGIISLKESFSKLPTWLFEILNGSYTENENCNFESFKTEFEKLQEEKAVNLPVKPKEELTYVKDGETVNHIPYVKVDDVLMAEISANKPIDFMLHAFGDAIGYYPIETNDVFVAIDKLFEEPDYIQHVYHYMKASTSKVKPGDYQGGLHINDIIEELEKRLELVKKDYTTSVEIICKEIPKDNIDKIIMLVNNCINDLLLDTDDQKQYLMSQIMENSISTYQHLQQILGLIESCDIIGSEMISYVLLNKYINNTSEISEIFQQSEGVGDLQLKLSVYTGLRDLFEKTISKEDVTV